MAGFASLVSCSIRVVPAFSTWRYAQELIEFFHMDVATFPPSLTVMENCWTWMIFACHFMVILLLEGFATSLVSASLGFIDANLFLNWSGAIFHRVISATRHNSWFRRPPLWTVIRAEETLTAPWTRFIAFLLSGRLNRGRFSSVCRDNLGNWFLSCMFTCLTALERDTVTAAGHVRPNIYSECP